MKRASTATQPSRFRAWIASLLFCSVAVAIGLSAAPQLHEALHKSDHTTHQCAATLLEAGNWEHSACAAAATAPAPAPETIHFVTAGLPAIARPETSILEHAPPALS